jgi:hypothetical protein
MVNDKPIDGAKEWPLYQIFGIKMASNYAFANKLDSASGVQDIVFCCVDKSNAAIDLDWHNIRPAYASQRFADNGERTLSIYRLDECDVIHFAGIADFYLWPGVIITHLLDPSYRYLVEIRLLGEVFSIWLELHGMPALHASAIVKNGTGGKTAAFLSTNKGGKSVLAATLMQEGHSLLTDDILAIEERGSNFLGRPGYPQMRMWPSEAEHFLGRYQDLEIVHPRYSKRRVPVGPDGLGSFHGDAAPLAILYLPHRLQSPTDIKIEPISPKDAVIELIRNSFSARIVEVLGLSLLRMSFFSRLAMRVPMRRLVYPSGFQHLPKVREAIIADLDETDLL